MCQRRLVVFELAIAVGQFHMRSKVIGLRVEQTAKPGYLGGMRG